MVSLVKNIKWFQKNSPLKSNDLNLIKDCKITFPDLYIDLLRISNGGYIDYDFQYYDIGHLENLTGNISIIYGFGGNKEYDVVYQNENCPEFFPSKLVAFAEVGNGDLICFDYRDLSTINPRVVYWNHEFSNSLDVSDIASSFEVFVTKLKISE